MKISFSLFGREVCGVTLGSEQMFELVDEDDEEPLALSGGSFGFAGVASDVAPEASYGTSNHETS